MSGENDQDEDPGFFEGLLDRATDSIGHSMRGIEESIDGDKDGSLLDDLLGGAMEEIPFVGEKLSGIGEEAGDFVTDLLGTRDEGLFSEEGTLDVDATTDKDYTGDGLFDGVGQFLNEELGIGQNNPADLLEGVGSPIGWLANEVREAEDPYEESDDTSEQEEYEYQ